MVESAAQLIRAITVSSGRWVLCLGVAGIPSWLLQPPSGIRTCTQRSLFPGEVWRRDVNYSPFPKSIFPKPVFPKLDLLKTGFSKIIFFPKPVFPQSIFSQRRFFQNRFSPNRFFQNACGKQ